MNVLNQQIRGTVSDLRGLIHFCRSPFSAFQIVGRNFGGLRTLQLGWRRVHLLTSFSIAQALLKKENQYLKSDFVFRQIILLTGARGMVQLPHAEAMKLRRSLSSTLTTSSLKRLREKFQSNFETVFSRVSIGRNISLSEKIEELVFRNALTFLFGEYGSAHLKLFPIFQELNQVCGSQIRSPLGMLGLKALSSRRVKKLGQTLRNQMKECVQLSDATPGSVVALLDKSDEEFFFDQLQTILFAGYETTASSLIFTLDALSRDPVTQAQIASEASLQPKPDRYNGRTSAKVYLKSLRDEPPTWTLARNCVEDDAELGFRKGDLIFIGVKEAQKNAPLASLSIESLLAFGGGSRICFGMALALFESALVLEQLLGKYRLQPAEIEKLNPRATITAHPDRALILNLSPPFEVARAI